MLLSFHLPLADLRSFIPNSGKLTAPDWPFPIGGGFIRGFGGIKRRKRGGLPDFVGEDILCDASGALKLETGHLRYGNKHSEFRCNHRRLFHDGLCFTRLEVGFTSTAYSRLNVVHTECALRNLLNIRLQPLKPSSFTLSNKPRLASAGRHLSTSYRISTTSTKQTLTPDPRWVMAGQPLVLLEYHKSRHEYATPPPHAKSITPPQLPNVNLDFVLLEDSGEEIPVWIIGALRQSHQRDVRDLRLCLSRLHAERECLARVLHGLALHIIAPKRSTTESDNLQRYLRDSLKRLKNLSAKQGEYLRTPEVIDLARGAIDHAQRGRSDALHQEAIIQLAKLDVRPSIIKATESMATLIYIENMTMTGDHLSNSTKTTISNSSIGSINNSFNNTIGKIEKDELKDSLTELKNHIEKLCEAAPPEKAKEIAKHFDKFVTEVTDSAPSKDYLNVSAVGLINAANTLAVMAGPITDTVKKIIDLVCG